jgi:predicted PurR-regulated permease PerM
MQPFARRIIVALALIALVVLLWYTAYVLLLAFAGILGAIVLDAITEWVRGRMRLSRDRAYLIVLAGVTSLIGVAIWQLAPRLIVQVSQLVQVVPRAIENLHYFLNQHGWGQALLENAPASLGMYTLLGRVTNIALKMIEAAGGMLVIAVVAAYVAARPGHYVRGLLVLFPPSSRGRVQEVLAETAHMLRRWMLGQLVPMTVLGIATIIGLWLLNIPLVFTLGLFTGLMIFIPYIGAFIAFLLTTVVTLSKDPSEVPYVVIFFLAVHIAEGYFLTPLVQRRAVYLPPALTILAQVLMAVLLGFLGLALATPMAAAVLTMVKMLYLHENPRVEE